MERICSCAKHPLHWFYCQMFFLFLEKADKGKCPFMAKELKMMTASEEPAQGETTSVGTEGKSSENT